jgi:hypothetical protein
MATSRPTANTVITGPDESPRQADRIPAINEKITRKSG